MGNANFRVHLGRVPLTTDWTIYVAPVNCSSIELTADVEWMWCTDDEWIATRNVPAFQREPIIPRSEKLIKQGEEIIWIKGSAAGQIYEKCVR
jgi:hypothetical protein